MVADVCCGGGDGVLASSSFVAFNLVLLVSDSGGRVLCERGEGDCFATGRGKVWGERTYPGIVSGPFFTPLLQTRCCGKGCSLRLGRLPTCLLCGPLPDVG